MPPASRLARDRSKRNKEARRHRRSRHKKSCGIKIQDLGVAAFCHRPDDGSGCHRAAYVAESLEASGQVQALCGWEFFSLLLVWMAHSLSGASCCSSGFSSRVTRILSMRARSISTTSKVKPFQWHFSATFGI